MKQVCVRCEENKDINHYQTYKGRDTHRRQCRECYNELQRIKSNEDENDEPEVHKKCIELWRPNITNVKE